MNLKDYIQGKRHGKAANKLEQEAMNDPFLQEAMEGFDAVEGDHFSTIEKLEKQLTPQPKKRKDTHLWIWAAAAMLILLVGIPILLYRPAANDATLATSGKQEPTEEITPAVPHPEDSTFIAKSPKTEPITDKEKKTVRKPAIPTLPQPQKQVQKQDPELLAAAKTEVEEIIAPEESISASQRKDMEDTINAMVLRAANDLQISRENSPEQTLEEKVSGLAPRKNDLRIRGISSLTASKKPIVGRVVDETGEPLIGATVTVKNTTTGATTDIDGKFRLTVPKQEKGTLVASHIGMDQQEIPLKQDMGDIVLKNNDLALNEVVVTGYGTQRKKLFTGSVSSVKTSHIYFGEDEFKTYFEKEYDKTICPDKPLSFTVNFYVNKKGKITRIKIVETSCSAIEPEIRRLLTSSPPWSDTEKDITLQIELE